MKISLKKYTGFKGWALYYRLHANYIDILVKGKGCQGFGSRSKIYELQENFNNCFSLICFLFQFQIYNI